MNTESIFTPESFADPDDCISVDFAQAVQDWNTGMELRNARLVEQASKIAAESA